MGPWCFEFLVSLVMIEIIWSLPLGCPYNGTSYGEGETVRTEEPCLSCVCQRGALQCNLRVCADHPNIPPPGCFFLHKPNDCCPQLFCEEENYNPVQFELQTGFKLENKVNVNDCSINGSIYAEGSTLASSRACEYCYCSEGEMKCIKPRCLRSFEGCKASYQKSSCCPTYYDCRNADSRLLKAQIKNFVLTSVDSKVSNNSSRTLSNLNLEPEKKSFPEIEPTEEHAETTTAKETVTAETTFNAENEATTFFAEDYLTSTGFQTAKTEHFSREPTTIEFTEETTLTAEATTEFLLPAEGESKETWNVRFRNKLNISEPVESSVATDEESRNSSFQEVEDYDSYDYGEPQLPPSLPNLVIFPFVAADAVIKEETADVLDIRDSKIEIKRVDVHPVFYKDYFSPPEKTEGGFVPKEPSKSSGPHYEQSFYKTRDVEGSGTESKTEAQWINGTSFDENVGKLKGVTGASFEDEALADINPPSNNVLSVASHERQKGSQTKKPVTVTYKSVVVDFYPNYLITTTRTHPNIKFAENSWSENPSTVVESLDRPPGNIKNTNTFINNTRDGPFDFLDLFPPKKTRETPTATSVKPSSLNDFLKTFMPGETTTTLSTKHKYSSKIKGQGNAVTAKTVGDEVTQKVKAETEIGVIFDSNSLLNVLIRPNDSTTSIPVPGKSKIYSSLRKQIKKGITELPASHLRATTTTGEINNEQVEFFQFLTEETPSSENVKRGTNASDGDRPEERLEEGVAPCMGALLKLAGCNIYGMMYRVGKVINELSGPCTECLCTDLGVQCRPLEC